MTDINVQSRIVGYFKPNPDESLKMAEEMGSKLTDADKRALAILIQQGNDRALEISNRFNCLSSQNPTAAV